MLVGTAPRCGARCEDDCRDGACSLATDFFKEYGKSCALGGEKVCSSLPPLAQAAP